MVSFLSGKNFGLFRAGKSGSSTITGFSGTVSVLPVYITGKSASYSDPEFTGKIILSAFSEGLVLNDINLSGNTITRTSGAEFEDGTWYIFLLLQKGSSSPQTLSSFYMVKTGSSVSYTNAVFAGKTLLATLSEGLVLNDVTLAGSTVSRTNVGAEFEDGSWYIFILSSPVDTGQKYNTVTITMATTKPSFSSSLLNGAALLATFSEGLVLNDVTLDGSTVSRANVGSEFDAGSWYKFLLLSN